MFLLLYNDLYSILSTLDRIFFKSVWMTQITNFMLIITIIISEWLKLP